MIYAVKTRNKVVKAYTTREQAEQYIETHNNKSYTITEINL